MTVFYFTATGNCLYAAKTIGGKLLSIPQLIKENKFYFEDDVIGFVFPIYVLTQPKIVKEFISKIKLKSNYIFAIGTYGNMSGACMYNLSKIFKKRNIELNYVDDIIMVDNYLPLFEMSDQINKIKDKKIEEKLESIVCNIRNKINSIPKPGIGERIITKIMNLLFPIMVSGKSATKYIVNDKCNKCGICVKLCPAGNIEIKENIKFNNKCEVCYACLHNCPNNALHLKNQISNVRFRNENICINEIIEANDQKLKEE